MLTVWAAEDVGFEPGVSFWHQGEAALHLSSRFLAQLVTFQARLRLAGFLTVL
jgi:hypothetical protein